MKMALLDIAPELAAEAFAVLRDAGAIVLGSIDAQPNLRVVVSHPDLPADCEADGKHPSPVVMMTVVVDSERRHKLDGFQINPWAAPLVRRAR